MDLHLLTGMAFVTVPGALAAILSRGRYGWTVLSGFAASFLSGTAFWIIVGFEDFPGLGPSLYAWFLWGFGYGLAWCVGAGAVALVGDLAKRRNPGADT